MQLMEHIWRPCTWEHTCQREIYCRPVNAIEIHSTVATTSAEQKRTLPPPVFVLIRRFICCAVTKLQICLWLELFFSFLPLSHKSHRPAHGEDGGRRSRRRPRGDALLLQGEDGQPRSDPALHEGQRTLMDIIQSLILTLTLILKPPANS